MVSAISSFLYASLSWFFLLLVFFVFEPVIIFSYGQVDTAEKFTHVTQCSDKWYYAHLTIRS